MHNDIENKFKRTGDRAKGLWGENNLQHLVLGQVDFINCLPINLPIELGKIKINAKIVNGVPSKLNEMILKGEIDIAPVSSVTYLENKDTLTPIGDLCIASDGPSDSVLLFSRYPLDKLNGAKIALSYASSTSNKLLEIILREFVKIKCTLELSSGPKSKAQILDYGAILLIGNHALSQFSKMPPGIFAYDLGSLWKKYTGLPMVFGMWVVRKNVETLHATSLADQLHEAKEIGLGPMFDEVIKKAQSTVLISDDFYKTYFKHLSYELTDECKKGLEVFEKYCKRESQLLIT